MNPKLNQGPVVGSGGYGGQRRPPTRPASKGSWKLRANENSQNQSETEDFDTNRFQGLQMVEDYPMSTERSNGSPLHDRTIRNGTSSRKNPLLSSRRLKMAEQHSQLDSSREYGGRPGFHQLGKQLNPIRKLPSSRQRKRSRSRSRPNPVEQKEEENDPDMKNDAPKTLNGYPFSPKKRKRSTKRFRSRKRSRSRIETPSHEINTTLGNQTEILVNDNLKTESEMSTLNLKTLDRRRRNSRSSRHPPDSLNGYPARSNSRRKILNSGQENHNTGARNGSTSRRGSALPPRNDVGSAAVEELISHPNNPLRKSLRQNGAENEQLGTSVGATSSPTVNNVNKRVSGYPPQSRRGIPRGHSPFQQQARQPLQGAPSSRRGHEELPPRVRNVGGRQVTLRRPHEFKNSRVNSRNNSKEKLLQNQPEPVSKPPPRGIDQIKRPVPVGQVLGLNLMNQAPPGSRSVSPVGNGYPVVLSNRAISPVTISRGYPQSVVRGVPTPLPGQVLTTTRMPQNQVIIEPPSMQLSGRVLPAVIPSQQNIVTTGTPVRQTQLQLTPVRSNRVLQPVSTLGPIQRPVMAPQPRVISREPVLQRGVPVGISQPQISRLRPPNPIISQIRQPPVMQAPILQNRSISPNNTSVKPLRGLIPPLACKTRVDKSMSLQKSVITGGGRTRTVNRSYVAPTTFKKPRILDVIQVCSCFFIFFSYVFLLIFFLAK